MSLEQRARLYETIRKYGAILVLGSCYLAFVVVTGCSIPCPIHFVTGLLCPGCGATRIMLSLFNGHAGAAFDANPALFCMAPVIVGLLIRDEASWVRTGEGAYTPPFIWWGIAAFFIVFTIWRNIPA